MWKRENEVEVVPQDGGVPGNEREHSPEIEKGVVAGFFLSWA